MANAFQDQLLKAGLVSKDKVNKTNKNKHKQVKQQSKNSTTEADKIKLQAQQAAMEKAERDRELNQKKVERENRKAITAQIHQLIELNAIVMDGGEVAYNFDDAKVIKQVYVTDAQRGQIINGRLAIVRLNASYALVPKVVAEKIMQRDASFVVLINDATQGDDEDDEYGDFKVPDDLMW